MHLNHNLSGLEKKTLTISIKINQFFLQICILKWVLSAWKAWWQLGGHQHHHEIGVQLSLQIDEFEEMLWAPPVLSYSGEDGDYDDGDDDDDHGDDDAAGDDDGGLVPLLLTR